MATKGSDQMTTQVKDINKWFGDYQALIDINLSIEEGEFIAILGPSGCGKTTLLRLLAGFDKPTSGTITINGDQVSSKDKALAPENRDVNMVFQSFALWPHLTIRQHIAFPLKYDKFTQKSPQEAKSRVDEVLEIIDMVDLADRLPSELSGGQKQRVSLGRSIATEPGLLLMDEPLSALDAELRIEMRREIQRLHYLTKASIVYVTHDQGEALAMADRIVVMNKGRIEQIGTPYEIYYQPQTEFVAGFVGKANIFQGQWLDDGARFRLNEQVVWDDAGTTESLKAEGLYCLRPDQIKFGPVSHDQLCGKILTKQFQGNLNHYSVETDLGMVIVHLPLEEDYQVGQEVSLVVGK